VTLWAQGDVPFDRLRATWRVKGSWKKKIAEAQSGTEINRELCAFVAL
jgi:hypothetical protein